MIKKILFAAILFLTTISVNAKITSHRGEVKDGYNFWLSTPDSVGVSEKDAKPVIIFLHGASLCGNDLNKVKRYGTIDAIEKGRYLDAYVIAPQNPGGAWKPNKIMNVLDYVSKSANIDHNRVYVLGMSLGGYGTIDLAATYPNRIAAAIAMCGGGSVKDLSGLSQVPLWIIHGTADRAVSVAQSDRVVNILKSSGDDRLFYDRIHGMNHGQPARMFYLKESYDWLFSHSLLDKDRSINDTFTVTQDRLRAAYKDLRSSRRSNTASYKSGKSSKTASTNRKKR
ncbi:MAG: phospholipase [Prevotella sp.]|nr:phospholipase [Bacteroides sp.]MCM1365961.1 phospholipase [Prevotella sp.]MCM1436618.1 phospholipase [Prevotella sp.]